MRELAATRGGLRLQAPAHPGADEPVGALLALERSRLDKRPDHLLGEEGDLTVGAGVSVGCPYAYCFIFKGGYVANLGELDEATELLERGIAMAREQGDIETAGWGHMWQTWVAEYGDEDAYQRDLADGIGSSSSVAPAVTPTASRANWRHAPHDRRAVRQLRMPRR